MSEETEAVEETAAEAEPATDEPSAAEEAAEETPAEEAADEAPAEEPASPDEPTAEAEGIGAAEDQVEMAADTVSDEEIAALEAEQAEEAIPASFTDPEVGARQAKVFLCDRGHRTMSIWSDPTVCRARPTRSGPECGRQLYPVGELPEQVQKALNPLKASKKAAKG